MKFLKKCITSIRQNSSTSHQIIIHVNEGSDGTTDWLKKEQIPFTHSHQNEGICVGFNKAFHLAINKLVMYMNDDMYVLPEWDEALVADMPPGELWMLSSTMVEPKGSGNACVVTADYGQDISSFGEHELLKNFSSLRRPDWSGASWPPVLMPQALWSDVGCFSVEYSPGMYSDPDLAMKVWQRGVRYFKGVGSSLVYHFQSRTTGRITPNEGRMTFMKKWGITPSFFYSNYLRMGQEWNGPLKPQANRAGELINRMRVRALTILA